MSEVILACIVCGGSISPFSPLIVDGGKHYCSLDCYGKKESRSKKCDLCQQCFWSGMHGVRTIDNQHWFHNQECYDKWFHSGKF